MKLSYKITVPTLIVLIAGVGLVIYAHEGCACLGKDARIISDLQVLRTAIEKSGDYSQSLVPNMTAQHGRGIKLGNQDIDKLLADIAKQKSEAFAITSNPVSRWALFVRLNSDDTQYYCLDSRGQYSQKIPFPTPPEPSCPKNIQ